MKRLILVRHAKSSWEDPDCADFDRPLTKRGKNDAHAMGELIRERGHQPTLIVSSPAKRAIATMKRIVGEMGLPEKMIVRDRRLYHANFHDLVAFVREIEDTHEDVVLCGHNPALTDFCNFMSVGSIDNLPTCGVVTMDFAVDSWKDVMPASGRILSIETPKKSHFAHGVQSVP